MAMARVKERKPLLWSRNGIALRNSVDAAPLTFYAVPLPEPQFFLDKIGC
jgi:hypothetical protein